MVYDKLAQFLYSCSPIFAPLLTSPKVKVYVNDPFSKTTKEASWPTMVKFVLETSEERTGGSVA